MDTRELVEAGPQEEQTLQPLSAGQRRVLRIIQQYEDFSGGLTPTTAYVAQRLQRDHKTIREHLRACHRKGWLRSPTPSGLWCRIG